MEADELPALALSRPTEALARAEALLAAGPSPREAAIAHQAAGVVLRDFGDIDQALVRMRAALRCARTAADAPLKADIRAAYGVALVMAGRTGAGLAQVGTAIRGAEGVAAGRIHIRRAHIFMLLGRHRPMLDDAERAASLLQSDDDVWLARAHNHRAIAHQALGHHAEADDDFARAEDLFRMAGQDLEYASARHDRASSAFARGDLPAALALLDDARELVDRLGVFEPDLAVTRTQVLLAAGLSRDAQVVADEAVARSRAQGTGSARHGELLLIAALAAHASGDLVGAVAHSTSAWAMFRRQHREWWADRAELTLLRSRFDSGEHELSLQRRAARLAGRLEVQHDPARAAEAHLLAGRMALARAGAAGSGAVGGGDGSSGAGSSGASGTGASGADGGAGGVGGHVGGRGGVGRAARAHLVAATRGGADLRARSAAELARAVLAEAEGRTPAMLAACSRGLRLIDLHLRRLGATELRAWATGQGAELSAMALRHAVAGHDPGRVLAWSERWRATVLAVPPLRVSADDALIAELSALRTLTRSIDDRDDHGAVRASLLQERRRLEEAVRRRVLATHGDEVAGRAGATTTGSGGTAGGAIAGSGTAGGAIAGSGTAGGAIAGSGTAGGAIAGSGTAGSARAGGGGAGRGGAGGAGRQDGAERGSLGARLRAELGQGTLVELADVDGYLHAVVLPGGATGRAARLVGVGPTVAAERALNHALFALRREATRRGAHRLDLGQVGARLQEFLLGAAAEYIGDGPCVLVPPGRLHAVPWALMPVLEDREFGVAPSASAWLRGRGVEAPANRRVVLVGGPGLSTGAEEVGRLARRYPGAVVLTGADATCERVLEAMDGAHTVHVAAHGTFRADSPLLSALELADGPLTVYDLQRLTRAPYRVVLSSCNSAVGAPTGADELLGVVTALIALGSAGVVASVVPVDDPTTVPFMTALHEALLTKDQDLGAALAVARAGVDDGDATARCTADSFVALGA